MAKLTKPEAGYLPTSFVGRRGVTCASCRDFIQLTSECIITQPPTVSPKGACILYLLGTPHAYGVPLKLVPQHVVGYTEEGMPAYCGKCEYFGRPEHALSPCAKVGDTEDDLVQYGGCCNLYQERK